MSAATPGRPIPKAFISYSWDGAGHQAWVKALAAKLRGHGVDVMLDQWRCRPAIGFRNSWRPPSAITISSSSYALRDTNTNPTVAWVESATKATS